MDETHPIRIINGHLQEVFENAYLQYVNKSNKTESEMYNQLNKLNQLVKQKEETKEEECSDESEESEPESNEFWYQLTPQVIGDVKKYIGILLGTLMEFYWVVLSQEDLKDMKEDLIESTTNMYLTGVTYRIVFSFFRLEK